MKRKITWRKNPLKFFMILSVVLFTNINAQKFELTPFYGWGFNGKAAGYYGDLNVRNNGIYGGIIDITVQPGLQVELYYSRSDTRADYKEFRGPTYQLTDASVNYFQIGVLRTVRKVNKVSLYGVGTLGATLFSPSGDPYDEAPEKFTYEDWWLFSITFGGGAKIFFSDKVGLRLEGRFMIPITWAGGGFMIGTGGSGFYLGGGSAIVQGSLMGGLTIALGN